MADVDKFLLDVAKEVSAATKAYPPLNSFHEGIAVILEEYKEAELEVFKKHADPVLLRKELVQLAAMCTRFVTELIDGKPDRHPIGVANV